MHYFCILKNNMYLCNVIKNKDYKKPPGLPKARQIDLTRLKKAGITGTPARKKKDTYLSNCSKFKDTCFSRSCKILVKNTFFEKIPYKRV